MLETPVIGELPEVSTVALRAVVRHNFDGNAEFPKQLFGLSDGCAATGIACWASDEGHFGIIVIDNQIVLSV